MFATAERAENSVGRRIGIIAKNFAQYFLVICGVAVTAAFSNIILGILCSKWAIGIVTALIISRAV